MREIYGRAVVVVVTKMSSWPVSRRHLRGFVSAERKTKNGRLRCPFGILYTPPTHTPHSQGNPLTHSIALAARH